MKLFRARIYIDFFSIFNFDTYIHHLKFGMNTPLILLFKGVKPIAYHAFKKKTKKKTHKKDCLALEYSSALEKNKS